MVILPQQRTLPRWPQPLIRLGKRTVRLISRIQKEVYWHWKRQKKLVFGAVRFDWYICILVQIIEYCFRTVLFIVFKNHFRSSCRNIILTLIEVLDQHGICYQNIRSKKSKLPRGTLLVQARKFANYINLCPRTQQSSDLQQTTNAKTIVYLAK